MMGEISKRFMNFRKYNLGSFEPFIIAILHGLYIICNINVKHHKTYIKIKIKGS